MGEFQKQGLFRLFGCTALTGCKTNETSEHLKDEVIYLKQKTFFNSDPLQQIQISLTWIFSSFSRFEFDVFIYSFKQKPKVKP